VSEINEIHRMLGELISEQKSAHERHRDFEKRTDQRFIEFNRIVQENTKQMEVMRAFRVVFMTILAAAAAAVGIYKGIDVRK